MTCCQWLMSDNIKSCLTMFGRVLFYSLQIYPRTGFSLLHNVLSMVYLKRDGCHRGVKDDTTFTVRINIVCNAFDSINFIVIVIVSAKHP